MGDCNCGKRKKRQGIRPTPPVPPASTGWLTPKPPAPKKEKGT